MGIYLVRFEMADQIQWGVLEKGLVFPLKGEYASLRELLSNGKDEWTRMKSLPTVDGIAEQEVYFLSPVTAPTRLLCLNANYPNPDEKEQKRPKVMSFFRKDDSAITGPTHDIQRPQGCRLIDGEVELGLVIGRDIYKAVEVNNENLGEYIAGWVVTNDICAHDELIKTPDQQWYKGKSYRTFCPTGPYLFVPDPDEHQLIGQLELKLWVNGELQQHLHTREMLFTPAESLTEASRFIDLSIGDCIMTGSGRMKEIKAPSAMVQKIGGMLFSEEKQTEIVIDKQARQSQYFQDGDIVEASIASKDQSIHLGTQRNQVRSISPGG